MTTAFETHGDLCLGFFRAVWDSGQVPRLPPGGRVLEVGCDEIDWIGSMRAVRPDLELIGIDWRGSPRPAATLRIIGDVLRQDFGAERFEAIVGVSVIEWLGVGYYGDPIDEEGDTRFMQMAHRWLADDGWLYLDTPYSATDFERRAGHLRAYNDAALETRLYQGLWRETRRWHFTGDGHPDGPYVALLLRKA